MRRSRPAFGIAADRLIASISDYPPVSPVSSSPHSSSCSWCSQYVLIRDLAIQGAQMLLVLLWRRCSSASWRKMKARLLLRQVRRSSSPISTWCDWTRKEVVLRRTRHGCSASPLSHLRRHWVAASLVPTFRTDLRFSWRPISSPSLRCSVARASSCARGPRRRHQLRRHRLSREVMIASLAEPAMLMIVFTLGADRRLDAALHHAAFMRRRRLGCGSRSGMDSVA